MSLVLNIHSSLSGISKIIDSLWPILPLSDSMKKVFEEKSLVAYLENLERPRKT